MCANAQITPRQGKDYAVFFYVTKFQSGWQSLPETEIESKALKAELETNYGFQCELVPNPTKQQILDKLANYNQRLGANDQILYYFSMHGHYDPSSDLGYLVAADGLADDPYFTTYLNYNNLRPYFATDKCKARHVLVALDACHSGSFGVRLRDKPGQPAYTASPDCVARISAALAYTGRQFVCSGNTGSKTPAKSAFAAQFLEALRKSPGQPGLLTFDDLSYMLSKFKTPEPENGTFAGHDPGGDFMFVKNGGCSAARQVPARQETEPQPIDPAADLEAWRTAKQQHTVEGYEEYLRRFPQGEFKDMANTALRQVEADAITAAANQRDDTAWAISTEKNTEAAYQKYLTEYPNGRHSSEAQNTLKRLRENQAWETAKQTGNYQNYVDGFCPGGSHCKEAEVKVLDAGLVFVKGGTFQMGCTNEQQDCRYDERPAHTVTVGNFLIGKYEVTNAEYCKFLNEKGNQIEGGVEWIELNGSYANEKCRIRKNGSGFMVEPGYENHPVIYVSWFGAKAFCNWKGSAYRLPTEAEWEYAARGGGGQILFGNGKSIADPVDINFAASTQYKSKYSNVGVYRQKLVPVGSLGSSNALGIYDMSGNVSEWCEDWYASNYYSISSSNNPTGPASGSDRVLRGGHMYSVAQNCRVAYREEKKPSYQTNTTGFRLVKVE